MDFEKDCIEIDAGVTDIEVIPLWAAIKAAHSSEEGIIHDIIAVGSGLNTLAAGVTTGLTVELMGDWQICFPSGNYVARVGGGNLIGGPGDDPIAYSAGVQTLLIQSAASTVVVTGGSIPTAAQNASAVWANPIGAAVSEKVDEVHVLNGFAAGKPATFTPTSRSAGGIGLTISGDGVTTTTVERT
jgi:hypothetical protein